MKEKKFYSSEELVNYPWRCAFLILNHIFLVLGIISLVCGETRVFIQIMIVCVVAYYYILKKD